MAASDRRDVTTAELRVACEELLEQVLRWRHPERFSPRRPTLTVVPEGKAEGLTDMLARKSQELGFTYTEEHARLEASVLRSRPDLSLGYDVGGHCFDGRVSRLPIPT